VTPTEDASHGAARPAPILAAHWLQRPGLAAVVVSWAFTWPASQVALRSWPPLLLTGVSSLMCGVLLTAVTVACGLRPWRAGMTQAVLWASLLNVTVGLGASTFAVYYLSGGVASLVVYVQPLLLVLIAHRFLGEELRVWHMVTIAIGFVGVALITIGASSQHASFAGIAIGASGALSWAVGIAYLRGAQRRTGDSHLITRVAGPQFLVGGAIVAALGSVFERWPSNPLGAEAWGSIGVFIVASAGGWLLYLVLLEHGAETKRLGAWSFAVPLLANAIGLVYLHESASPFVVAGGATVMISIAAVERPWLRGRRSGEVIISSSTAPGLAAPAMAPIGSSGVDENSVPAR